MILREIIVIGPLPPPVHGASLITEAMACHFDSVGHRVTRLTTSINPPSRFYHVHRAIRVIAALREIVKRRKEKPLIYQGGHGGFGLLYQLLTTIVVNLSGLQQVFHHHSYAYLNKPSIIMSTLCWAGRKSTTHVVLSSRMGELLQELYGKCRVEVVSNAAVIEPSTFSGASSSQMGSEGPRIGHLGNLSVDKGVLRVLGAVERLEQDGWSPRLNLAGPIDDKELESVIRSFVARSPLYDWLGPLPVREVPQFMRSLDCFVFPSDYVNEAEPLVVLESLREGTPAVVTARGAMPDLVPPEWIIAINTAEGIASSIVAACSSEDSRRIATECFQTARSQQSVSSFIEKIVGV